VPLVAEDNDILVSVEGDALGHSSVKLDFRLLTSLLSSPLFLFTNIPDFFPLKLPPLTGGGGGGATSCITGLLFPSL
jgi:hypothetical protein